MHFSISILMGNWIVDTIRGTVIEVHTLIPREIQSAKMRKNQMIILRGARIK